MNGRTNEKEKVMGGKLKENSPSSTRKSKKIEGRKKRLEIEEKELKKMVDTFNEVLEFLTKKQYETCKTLGKRKLDCKFCVFAKRGSCLLREFTKKMEENLDDFFDRVNVPPLYREQFPIIIEI